MAWVKRAKGGLWSDIMTVKVINPINIWYLESKDIHKMHVGIKHVIESFEEVHKAYKDQKDDNITMYTPIDHLSIIRIIESLTNNKPILKNLQEIVEVLNLGNSDLDNRITYLKHEALLADIQ